MPLMSRLISISILVFAFSLSAFGGEITYTARATIFGGDVRTAQKNALSSALLGGIRSYITTNEPDYQGEITSDYLMFINSYTITKRQLTGGAVSITVHIILDETITDDSATYMTTQANSAVFLISGLPNYVDVAEARRAVSDVFVDSQFSVNDQIAFEQEIIDQSRRADVLTAFQAVSSQYMFEFKFNVKSFKAGETCTLEGTSSYSASSNITKIVPIISTEVSVDDEDPSECLLKALNTSVDNALVHVRETFIPAPEIKREVYKYTLNFTDVPNLKDVTDLLEALSKRRFLIKYEMTDFYSNQAAFNIECYLEPDEMAEKIAGMEFASVEEVTILDDEVTLKMRKAEE